MEKYRVIEIKQSIFADNDKQADALREKLKEKGVFLLNLMSSPGAGKTTTLSRTIEMLKQEMQIGVMEADIDSDVDAAAIENCGVRVIQLHTGGMCHLDAGMTEQGITEFGIQGLDLLILENVGNLVCPAEFDTGAVKNAMILSVPEGHDKPLKYPLMFQVCDVVLVNKTDVLPYFDFDLEKCVEYVHMRNPQAKVIPICAKTGDGMEAWADWLRLSWTASSWEMSAMAAFRLSILVRSRATALSSSRAWEAYCSASRRACSCRVSFSCIRREKRSLAS